MCDGVHSLTAAGMIGEVCADTNYNATFVSSITATTATRPGTQTRNAASKMT